VDGSLVMLKKQELKDMYEHDHGGVNLKKWLHDPNIRRFRTYDTYPNAALCPDDTFNMWKPFTFKDCTEPYEYDHEAVAFVRGYLETVICSNFQPLFLWLLLYIGHLVQRPEIKTGKVIQLEGLQGIGKSSFGTLLGAVTDFDNVTQKVQELKFAQVFAKFNGPLLNAFIIVLDECPKLSGFLEQFKSFVTQPSFSVELKNMESSVVKSFHNLILTTNKSDLGNSTKDERRTAIFPVSSIHMGKSDYWTKEFYPILGNERAMRSVFDYFDKEVVVPANFKTMPIPFCELQVALQTDNRSQMEHFVEYLTRLHAHEKFFKLTACAAFCIWKEYAETNGIVESTSARGYAPISNQSLGKMLNTLSPKIVGLGLSIKDGKGNMGRVLDIAKLKAYFGVDLEEKKAAELEAAEEKAFDEKAAADRAARKQARTVGADKVAAEGAARKRARPEEGGTAGGGAAENGGTAENGRAAEGGTAGGAVGVVLEIDEDGI